MDQGGARIPTIQPARLGEGARRVGPRVLGVEHQADGDGGHVLRQVLACQCTCSGARSAHRPRMKRESLPFRPSGLGFPSQSRAGQMSHSGQNPTLPAAARQSPNIKTSTAHAPRSVRRRKVRAAKLIADGLWVDLRRGKYDPIRQLRVGTPDADHVSCLPAGTNPCFCRRTCRSGFPQDTWLITSAMWSMHWT